MKNKILAILVTVAVIAGLIPAGVALQPPRCRECDGYQFHYVCGCDITCNVCDETRAGDKMFCHNLCCDFCMSTGGVCTLCLVYDEKVGSFHTCMMCASMFVNHNTPATTATTLTTVPPQPTALDVTEPSPPPETTTAPTVDEIPFRVLTGHGHGSGHAPSGTYVEQFLARSRAEANAIAQRVGGYGTHGQNTPPTALTDLTDDYFDDKAIIVISGGISNGSATVHSVTRSGNSLLVDYTYNRASEYDPPWMATWLVLIEVDKSDVEGVTYPSAPVSPAATTTPPTTTTIVTATGRLCPYCHVGNLTANGCTDCVVERTDCCTRCNDCGSERCIVAGCPWIMNPCSCKVATTTTTVTTTTTTTTTTTPPTTTTVSTTKTSPTTTVGRGDPSPTEPPTIMDALEILKQLAGLANTAPKGSTINDALEVLKKLAGLPSVYDKPTASTTTAAALWTAHADLIRCNNCATSFHAHGGSCGNAVERCNHPRGIGGICPSCNNNQYAPRTATAPAT